MIAWLVLLCAAPAAAQDVIQDSFEYTVGRSTTDKDTPFQAAGWTGVKSEPQDTGANGYLYTIGYGSISGGCGTSPNGSDTALAIEALPATESAQTDFYLQLGNTSVAVDTIPGDVWFQFWSCSQDTGSNQSARSNRNKFIYVCNAGGYPCSDHLWMFWDVACDYNPLACPDGDPSDGTLVWGLGSATGASTIAYTGSGYDPDTQDQVDQSRAVYNTANTWVLTKMHINTTATSGNSWEMWQRVYGNANWTKTAEWIGGTTPDFVWNIGAGDVGGHRELRMPSTVGHATDNAQRWDYYLYMDDFTIANTENDLPTYQDGAGGSSGTIRIRIVGAALPWILLASVVPLWQTIRRRRTQ